MDEINNENDSLIYEVGFHLLPTVDESDVLAQSLNIKSIIEESGGTIISEDVPKMTVLAYDISKSVNSKKQKFNKAYFGWVKFEIGPSKIAEIKTKIENIMDVLRFLIIKTVRENTIHTPKIPMFKKESIREGKSEEQVEKPKVSEEEIDKSIDELVIDQTL
ncbi:MAG: 30S ribosomal protein S6 [Candidatus Zambryskibacteria bacterium]